MIDSKPLLSRYVAPLALLTAAALSLTACARPGTWHTYYQRPCSELGAEEVQRPRHMVNPFYPREARESGTTGFVVVRVILGADGEVVSAETVRSKPEGVFDAAALDAIRQWRFCAPSSVSTPYPEPLKVRITFQL